VSNARLNHTELHEEEKTKTVWLLHRSLALTNVD